MSVTVGEVTAVLSARDEMSKVVKDAQATVKDFDKSSSDALQHVAKGADDLAAHAATAATDTLAAATKMQGGFTGVRGTLNDLATGAGLTVAELGAMDAALLVAGTAFAGWKIGRAISDFFDLDKVIGDATAKLLGWGDVAAEAAGAKADMLARASAKVGYEVKDVTTAMQINATVMTYWRSGSEASADAFSKVQAKLEEVRSRGDIPALTADIQSHNFSLKELATFYHTSVEALQLFTRELKSADDEEKAASEEIQRRNKFKLEGLREEIAERARLSKATETAIYQIAELEAKADEAEITRSKNRLQLDETSAQARVAMELALDQQRVDNGTMTQKQFLDEKASLERQGYDRHLALLKAEENADIASTGQKLDAELAKIDERYAKGLLSKTQYEAEYAAVERRYAAIRAGLQDAYTAHVIDAQQKVALSAQEAQAAMVADFRKTNDAVMGITASFDGWNNAIMQVDRSVKQLAADQEALDRGNTLDLATAAQDPEIMAYLKQGYSLKNAEALKLGKQWGFTPQLFDEKGNPESSPSPGEGVPGYAPTTPPKAPPAGGNIGIGPGSGGGGSGAMVPAPGYSGGAPGINDPSGRFGYAGPTAPAIQVTVQGNVYTMDPSGKAAFGQLVVDSLTPLLRQGRLLPNA